MISSDDVATRPLPVVRLTPHAAVGHRHYHELPRSDEEVFDEAHTCEPLELARARLGPRLRCECGRSFGSRIALTAHHLDTRDRDDRRC